MQAGVHFAEGLGVCTSDPSDNHWTVPNVTGANVVPRVDGKDLAAAAQSPKRRQ